MSIQSSHIYCTSCIFESVLPSYPLTLIYQLPNGEELVAGPSHGWCNNCNGVRYVEPDFAEFFDTESKIIELENRVRSPVHAAKRALNKMLGGEDDSEEDELKRLRVGLALAKARGSSPRCTVCWSDAPGNVSALDRHSCGGEFVMRPPSGDSPRISYAHETIYLDFEGFRVDKFGTGDGYADLASRVNIDAVVQDGQISGFLVFGMFEKDLLKPMLIDQEVFRRFARIIELRISHEDFDNPLSHFTEGTNEAVSASVKSVPRALFALGNEPVSKWLRWQIDSDRDC